MMSDLMAVLQHGLVYGGLTTVLMSVIIFGSLYQNPEIWLHDAPAEIQARLGPMSATAKRQRLSWALAMGVGLVGLMVWSIIQLPIVTGAPLTFTAVFLSTLVMLMTFNLVDLLIIDWLIIVTLQPRWMMLKGAEDLVDYNDYGFHGRAFLKGTVGIVLASAVIAGLAVVLATVARGL